MLFLLTIQRMDCLYLYGVMMKLNRFQLALSEVKRYLHICK